jgi:hypothetical protein
MISFVVLRVKRLLALFLGSHGFAIKAVPVVVDAFIANLFSATNAGVNQAHVFMQSAASVAPIHGYSFHLNSFLRSEA